MELEGKTTQPEAQGIALAAEQKPMKSGFLREAWEFLKIILIAFLIALPIRYFIAQPFIVRGESMIPNFQDGDYLIIDELSYYMRPPERGEVVVFRYPLDRKQFFIKRVIGLPGEEIEIQDGKVHIFPATGDEITLDEKYLSADLITNGTIRTKLRDNQYFVLGDNRPFSSDSRIWGLLDQNFITGRALIRAWPPSEAGFIPKVAY